MAVEEGWRRRFPHVELDPRAASELLGRRVIGLELLSGGLRNTNYRLQLADEPYGAVLRLYTADPSACAREAALLRLVAGRVPVPSVIRSNPAANPAWILIEWLPGVRFDQMLSSASPADIGAACFAAGEVLAAIHSFSFSGPGGLGPTLEIAEPMGYPWLTGVREFFTRDRARQLVGGDLATGVVQLIDREAWRLAQVWSQSQLVHADYKPWNMLVHREHTGWQVSAVLDWEFSLSGPPLCDLGIFLRYSARMPPEYEVGFLDGYRAGGGQLLADARNLARLIDLVSLWTFLERADGDMAMIADVRPLLEETVRAFESRAP